MAFSELEIKLIAEVGDLNAKLKEATKGVEGWATKNASTIKTVGNNFIALGTAITGVMALSLREFAKFSQAMANLGTDETVAVREQLTSGIKELASTYGVTADVLAGSLDAIQNVTGDATKSLLILSDATKLAVAENVDLAESSNALLNIMRIYGDELKNTEDASNLLFKASEKSKDGFTSVVNGLTAIMPAGKQLGITVNDLTSLFTNASNAMGDTGKATFGLKAILGDLIAPSAGLTKYFRELGVETRGVAFESGKMAVENLGLMDILDRLSKLDADRLDSLISNRRELIALTPLLKDLNKIRQDSADYQNREGATAQGLAVQMGELSRQMLIVKQNIELQAVAIGENLAPIVAEFVNKSMIPWLKSIQDFTKANPEATKEMIKFFAVLGPGLIVIGTFIRSFITLTEAYLKFKALGVAGGPIAGLIIAIPVVIGMLAKMAKAIDDITIQQPKLQASFSSGTFAISELSAELRELIAVKTDLTETEKLELAGSARRLDQLRMELEMELEKKNRNQENIDLIILDIQAEKGWALALEEKYKAQMEANAGQTESNELDKTSKEYIEKKTEAIIVATDAFVRYAQQFDTGKISQDAFREGLRGIVEDLANTVGSTEEAITILRDYMKNDFTADVLINPPNPTVIEQIKTTVAQLREDLRLLNADADEKDTLREQLALERRIRELDAIVSAEKIKTQVIIELANAEFKAIEDNIAKIAEQRKLSTDEVLQDEQTKRDKILEKRRSELAELEILIAQAKKLETEKTKIVVDNAKAEVEAKNSSTNAQRNQNAEVAKAPTPTRVSSSTVNSISEGLATPFQLGQVIRTTKNSYAEGTNYVPTTGNYKLHRGEQVVPASENPYAKGGSNNVSGGSVTIINLFEKDAIPEIMAQYPNATLNIVNKDILNNGITRRVIRSVG